MDVTDKEREGLARLGYHPRWLERGILTRSTLRRQLEELAQAGADTGVEHFRWGALLGFLESRATLTDGEIQAVLDLAEVDPELGTAFPHQLIRFPGLTDEQFEVVARCDVNAAFDRVVVRLRVTRRLAAGTPLDAVFDDAIASPDGQLHSVLLEHPELTREQAEVLATRGANRGVRNRARESSQRRRW